MTDDLTPWQLARRALDDLTRDCQTARDQHPDDDDRVDDLPSPEDVLSIDRRVTVTVLLAYGGPTIGADYVFSGSEVTITAGDLLRAEYWTTDNPRSETVRVQLDDDEAELFADIYCGGLDNLADMAGGEA